MLKFYFNIEVEKVVEENGVYHFLYHDFSFYLMPFERSVEEFNDIYAVCQELKSRQIPVHTFIRNKEDQIITKIYETDYILMKIECREQEEINVIDMMQFNNALPLAKAKSALYRNNWGELWSKKVDYFEYQIRELGKDKKVILNSFSYYVGLAENAISYVNFVSTNYEMSEMDRITLSHKRIRFPNLKIHYFNPLNFIFDLEVRDIAEYIKAIFFTSPAEAKIELKAFLRTRKLSIYGYQMFFARLLYPSYYFDIYESVMNKNSDEEKMIPIIEKANSYELFLKEVYFELSNYAPIDSIDWIVNKKEL